MHLFFLFCIALILSACMNTDAITPSEYQKSTMKIRNNQTDAQNAQDEYKKLQKQRVQE